MSAPLLVLESKPGLRELVQDFVRDDLRRGTMRCLPGFAENVGIKLAGTESASAGLADSVERLQLKNRG